MTCVLRVARGIEIEIVPGFLKMTKLILRKYQYFSRPAQSF